MTPAEMEDLQYLIKIEEKTWKKRDRVLIKLFNTAPKLDVNDYYLIEMFHKVVKALNEPFQPCANHYHKALDVYINWTLNFLIATEIISKIEKSNKEIKNAYI